MDRPISPLELGEPLRAVAPNQSKPSAIPNHPAHKLGVRIACHIVHATRSEAQVLSEVESCMKDVGEIPLDESAIGTFGKDEVNEFEYYLATAYGWDRSMISDWVSATCGAACSS